MQNKELYPYSGQNCLPPFTVYTSEMLSKLIAGRKVAIYGAARVGRSFLMMLRGHSLDAVAYLDRNPSLWGTIDGLPVYKPEKWLSDHSPALNTEYFILVSNTGRDSLKEIRKLLKRFGIVAERQDYITAMELYQVFPTVDISGSCNLHCISCPRGNTLKPMKSGGMMSAKLFSKILAKLKCELPFLYEMELYIWGEPLLNRELPDIVSICKANNVSTAISTNLNSERHLEAVLKSGIEEIRVGCGGFGAEHYEHTEAGGSWEKFRVNLEQLARLRNKFSPDTRVVLHMHVSRNNISDYSLLKKLASDIGITFEPIPHFVFHDVVLDFLTGESVPATAIESINMLCMPLEEQLRVAHSDAEHKKACYVRRFFPNISWDGSVYTCVEYTAGKIADSFLDVPMGELLERRNKSELCKVCIGHSLHRYPLVTQTNERLAGIIADCEKENS
jgi:MoaA/NifB/PqqE/SkfB family radical SAM enzyme